MSNEESRVLQTLLATPESSANDIAREGFGIAVGQDLKAHGKQR